MKSSIYNIIESIAIIVLSLIKIIYRLWLMFCISFLKKTCHIETPTYRKYWSRHSRKIQKMLDKEHQHFFLASA